MKLPRNQGAAARDLLAIHAPEGAGARDFLAIRAPPLETSSHLKCPRAPPLETSSHPRDDAHFQKTESRGRPRNVSIPNLKISDSLLFFLQAPRGTSEEPPLETSSQLRRPRAPPLETSSRSKRRRSRLPRNSCVRGRRRSRLLRTQEAAARDSPATHAPESAVARDIIANRAPHAAMLSASDVQDNIERWLPGRAEVSSACCKSTGWFGRILTTIVLSTALRFSGD